MANEIKFTGEEVNEINNIRTQLADVFRRLGELDVRKKQIEVAREEVLGDYNTIREQEQQLFSKLNEKYGDGNYNPETNVFTPVEQLTTSENN